MNNAQEPRSTVPTAPAGGKSLRAVVIGAGPAGVSAVESLRAAAPEAEITLVSKEPALPYYRLNLTRYLAGEITADDLLIRRPEWYDRLNIRFLRGVEMAGLSLADGVVQLRGGEKLPYDRLVLTVGAHPFLPPIPGAYRDGVITFRSRDDADAILAAAAPGARCVCIGGGTLGLETAAALAQRGVEVTLVEEAAWVLSRQVNERAGELLARRAGELRIRLRMGARVKEIAGDERVHGVVLNVDECIPADLVIVATGIRTNSNLARMAGLKANQGILVDDRLASSDPRVFAAGDVAEHRGIVYGLWTAALAQGKVAGTNAGGGTAEFTGMPRITALKVLGVKLFSIGLVTPSDPATVVIEEESGDRYYRFLFTGGRLTGAVILGDSTLNLLVRKAVETQSDFTALLARKPGVGDVIAAMK